MTLNIQATRRLSLSGFAVGWDDCYLLVKAVSRSDAIKANEEKDRLQEANDEKGFSDFLANYCTQYVTGGAVMNTLEDGSTVRQEITADEVPYVVDALNTAWQLEVISVSTGSDRLK